MDRGWLQVGSADGGGSVVNVYQDLGECHSKLGRRGEGISRRGCQGFMWKRVEYYEVVGASWAWRAYD